MLLSNLLIHPSTRIIQSPVCLLSSSLVRGAMTIRFETQSPSLLKDVVCLQVLINEQCWVQTTPGHSARVPHVTKTSSCSVLHTESQATMWLATMIWYTRISRTLADFRVHSPFEFWKRELESSSVNGCLSVMIKTPCDCLTLNPN
jgi:hypothetical protein